MARRRPTVPGLSSRNRGAGRAGHGRLMSCSDDPSNSPTELCRRPKGLDRVPAQLHRRHTESHRRHTRLRHGQSPPRAPPRESTRVPQTPAGSPNELIRRPDESMPGHGNRAPGQMGQWRGTARLDRAPQGSIALPPTPTRGTLESQLCAMSAAVRHTDLRQDVAVRSASR
jgi:hypothetical protein